jgi:hypothetical protein
MKKPILFSQKMVKAILSGGKTQTRREIKHFGNILHYGTLLGDWGLSDKPKHRESNQWEWTLQTAVDDNTTFKLKSPFAPGDQMWVKEAFFAFGRWEKNGTTKTGKQKYRFNDKTLSSGRKYLYQTNSERPEYINTEKDGFIHWYKRNSLFMPLKAARIYLKVEEVRAEKLMDISEQDILKEGIILPNYAEEAVKDVHYPDPWEIYFGLWEEINGIGTVEKNPWVWVYTFKLLYE